MDNEYIDLYLKFESEEQANLILFDAQVVDNQSVKIPKYSAIDIIGIIYKNSLPLEGWHVNIRVTPGEDVSALEAYKIPEPKTPSRVWA